MSEDEDFQRRATEEGRVAQGIAEKVIRAAGFRDVERNKKLRHLGVTMNFVATDGQGDEWLFDVSGSFTSDRAGLIRTDTMWKTLGRANVLSGSGCRRLLLLTTNLPKQGSAGDQAMRAAAKTFFDAVEMLTTEGKERLRRYAGGGPASLAPLPGYRTAKEVYGVAVRRETGPGTLSLSLERAGDAIPVKVGYSVTELPNRFKVYLPSTTSSGESVGAERRKEVGTRILEILSEEAGGCTSSEGQGIWVDPVLGVVHENVTAIEAYSINPLPYDAIWEVLRLVVDDLDQSAAALVVGDRMYHFAP